MMKRPIHHSRVAILLALVVAFKGYANAQESHLCSHGLDQSLTLQQTVNLVQAELFTTAECGARSLIRSQPTLADAHYLLGYILNRRGKADESLSEYTRAAQLREPSAQDLAVVALDYALLRDYFDAEKWMAQALRREQKNALDWYYLGRIRYSYSAFGLAREAFEKALSLAPKDARTLYNLGLTYEGLGDDDRAMQLYQQAIDVHAGDAQPYFDLASLFYRHDEPAKALPLLLQAAALDPKNPGIRERLAKVQEQSGDLTASRKNLQSAVSLAPTNVSLHYELGRVDQKLHLIMEAKQEFDLCAGLHGASDGSDEQSLNFTEAQ